MEYIKARKEVVMCEYNYFEAEACLTMLRVCMERLWYMMTVFTSGRQFGTNSYSTIPFAKIIQKPGTDLSRFKAPDTGAFTGVKQFFMSNPVTADNMGIVTYTAQMFWCMMVHHCRDFVEHRINIRDACVGDSVIWMVPSTPGYGVRFSEVPVPSLDDIKNRAPFDFAATHIAQPTDGFTWMKCDDMLSRCFDSVSTLCDIMINDIEAHVLSE